MNKTRKNPNKCAKDLHDWIEGQSTCKSCRRISSLRWNTSDKGKKYLKEWNSSPHGKNFYNTWKQSEKAKLWKAEWMLRYGKKYYEEYNRKYEKSDKRLIYNSSFERKKSKYELNAKRRAIKRNAVPRWLSDEQKLTIETLYLSCPKGYHIDHIVPLQGKNVSGLHVPWNLQILSAKDNLKKGNKL